MRFGRNRQGTIRIVPASIGKIYLFPLAVRRVDSRAGLDHFEDGGAGPMIDHAILNGPFGHTDGVVAIIGIT